METNDEPVPVRKFSRRRWLFVLAAFVAVLSLVWFVRTDSVPDPEMRGHRLSYYVDLLQATYTTGDGGHTIYPVTTHEWAHLPRTRQTGEWAAYGKRADVAGTAVELIGSEGFPWLLNELGREESAWARVLSKSPRWVLDRLLKFNISVSPTQTYLKRWQAVTAIRQIDRAGTDMTPIMPDLLILATNTDPDIKMAAGFLIGQLDRKQLASLEAEEKLSEASKGTQ
jgi:hypothetical protein